MESSYESAAALVSRAAGPLADHLGPFVASLIEQRYAANVVYIKARHALAFDRWLAKRHIALTDLSEVHIEQYQRRRRHRSSRAETRRRERCEVTQLLQFLRGQGVCEAAYVDSTPADDLAADFGHYLQDRQRLATATIKRYRTVAWQFLDGRFGRGEVDLHTLCAGDAIDFVQRQAKRMKPPALKCVVNAMRSFLRYLQYRGEIAPNLVAAVPAVATWTTTPPLPRAISPEHAQRAIDSCDRRTSLGLRDRGRCQGRCRKKAVRFVGDVAAPATPPGEEATLWLESIKELPSLARDSSLTDPTPKVVVHHEGWPLSPIEDGQFSRAGHRREVVAVVLKKDVANVRLLVGYRQSPILGVVLG